MLKVVKMSLKKYKNKMRKDEYISELEDILIGLLYELEVPTVRIMATMAIIRAFHIEQEMINWVATFSGKEDTLTIQAFMSKLNELTDTTEME